MRAIIYTRVSTDAQEENYSLPSQLSACRRYAEQNGMTIAAELNDVMTGSKLDRPGLTKVRDLIRVGAADVLLVYASDRLTRSVAHSLLLREELRNAGMQWHAVTKGQASPDTPEGGLMETIEASFAEYERLKFRERSLRGKRTKLEGGNILGQGSIAPYGYQWIGVKREKRMEINEPEASVVRQITAWYLDGVGVRGICLRLDAAGIPTPAASRATSAQHFVGRGTQRRNEWARPSVYAMLRDQTYVGRYYYPSHDLTVPVPAIIEEATWQAVQARLNVGRQRAHRNAHRSYLLRTRIRCYCGHAMAGRTNVRNEREHRYYVCTSKTGDTVEVCTNRTNYHVAAVDAAVWNWIETEVLNDAHIQHAADQQRATYADQRATLEAEQASYQRQLDALATQTSKLAQLFAADIFTLDEVAAQKRQIDTARASAQTERDRVTALLGHTGPNATDVDAVRALAREVRARLDAGVSEATKQQVVELLDTEVIVERDATGAYANVTCYLTLDNERLPIVSTPSAS